MASLLLTFSSLSVAAAAATSSSTFATWGSSGGNGPTGGIGDVQHPVLQPQSFITDGYVPITPNTTRQLAPGPAPILILPQAGSVHCNASRRRVTVDSTDSGAQQEMLGFGHAITDSTVQVFNQLQPQLLDQLMSELFGQDGNNMQFVRHTIGSSDLSGVQYSYDDNGPSFNLGEPDPSLADFSLGTYGTQMVELLAKMGDYKGDVFLYGAPWSYPGWMKNNDLFIAQNDGGNHFLLNNSLNPAYYSQAANYLIKYVDAYKAQGVTINGLSLQNEPLNYQGGYPCMFLDAADEAALLQGGLGAALHARNVKVLAYDHNTDQPAYPARVIQGAPDYVDAAAWHCYQGPVADYTILDDFRHNFPNTPQFMTECSNTGLAPGTTNFWVAQNFIPSVRYGASGGSFWVLATDANYGPHSPYGGCGSCSGSVFVNSSTVYEKTIDYYMVGHFSRYIRKGGINHRILSGLQGAGTDWTSQFFAIAIQNPDQGWAVVFLNTFPEDQDVDLDFTESGFLWQGTIPASSVVTWLLPADTIASGNRTGGASSVLSSGARTSSRTSSATSKASVSIGSAGATSSETMTTTATSASSASLLTTTSSIFAPTSAAPSSSAIMPSFPPWGQPMYSWPGGDHRPFTRPPWFPGEEATTQILPRAATDSAADVCSATSTSSTSSGTLLPVPNTDHTIAA